MKFLTLLLVNFACLLFGLFLYAKPVSAAETIKPQLNWGRSKEDPNFVSIGNQPGEGVNQALSLPIDSRQPVWDQSYTSGPKTGIKWAHWSLSTTDICFTNYETRHFQATFTIPPGLTVTKVILSSPYYQLEFPESLPINDNVYIFVNGMQVASKGTSYPGARNNFSVYDESRGWYVDGDLGNPPANSLHTGLNTLDVITEEYCGDGGMGYLELKLEVSDELLTDQELAQKYSPILYVDQNDYLPRPVEIMMDKGRLSFDEGAIFGFINPPLSSSNLYTHKDSRKNYINLPPEIDNATQHKSDYNQLVATNNYPITVYTRVVRDSNHIVIQYWFFSYYNDWWNKHEGDWEMIEVVLDENQEPQFAAYSQHGDLTGGGTKRNWSDVIKDEEGGQETHPRVYVGVGSHASYFQYKGDGYEQKFAGAGQNDQVVTTKSIQPVNLVFIPEKNGAAAENFGWLAYEGFWGEFNSSPNLKPPRGPAENHNSKWFDSFNWGKERKDDLKKWGFTKVTIHSPVDLRFYDSNGNQVDKNESQIPDAEYLEDTENEQKTIIVPAQYSQGLFKIELIGTGVGVFDLEILTTDLQSNTSYEVSYSGIPVTTTTVGQVLANQDHSFQLQLDYQNDGVFEITILPSRITQEPYDTASPTIYSNISGARGDNDWYTSDVTVELSAQDPGGPGVNRILYDVGDGLSEYTDPITLTSEGINFLQFSAIDNAGNSSEIGFIEIKIDKTPPSIQLNSPSNQDYLHSDIIPVDFEATDNGSGVLAMNIILDGSELTGENIDLFFENLGSHNLEVEVKDNAGNVSASSVSFDIIASFESLLFDIERAYSLGLIDNIGIKNSLIKKINAVMKIEDNHSLETGKGYLSAFINEVEAQKGKHITNQTAKILIDNASYLSLTL